MINTDRIVPVMAIDLLSLYGLILKQDSNNSSLAKLDAIDTAGSFEITSGTNPLFASEPVEICDIKSTVSAVTFYFVPAYDYKGFTIGGSAVVPTGAVEADGRTLYKAVLSSGAITITKAGF